MYLFLARLRRASIYVVQSRKTAMVTGRAGHGSCCLCRKQTLGVMVILFAEKYARNASDSLDQA